MHSVVETPTFTKQADKILSEEDLHKLIDWIVVTALAGVLIPDSEGARKVRYPIKGRGKRGGLRVIYFNLAEQEVIYLIAIYEKMKEENMSLKKIKKNR